MKYFISKVILMLLAGFLSSCISYSSPASSTAPTTSPPRIPYWTMDVVIDNFSLSGNSSVQTAYFFRDLQSMGSLTGFPQGDFKTSYNWVELLYNISPYVHQIFATMRNENFGAAFILWGTGTNRYGEPYWLYSVFLLRNGVGYYDDITRTNRPVRF